MTPASYAATTADPWNQVHAIILRTICELEAALRV